mgnify:FL=1
MRDVSPIEKVVLEKESKNIGGMVVLIWGEQGAGKTRGLTRMVMYDLGIENVGDEFNPDNAKRIPIWKAQTSCQWIVPAAQGIPITLWIHDTVDDFEFYLTGSKKHDLDKRILNLSELDGLDIKIKRFSDWQEFIDGLEVDRLNSYFMPGSNGDSKDKYFYQRKAYDLCKALNNRDFGDHITLNWDEVHNEAPDEQKQPFYDLQMNLFPSQWEDFRKEKITLRGLGHGYTGANYKLYDEKETGTIYMQGAKVHNKHTMIDQGQVNGMERGDFVVNGFEAGSFDLPLQPKQIFDWIPNSEDVRLKMDVSYSVPDIRPENESVEQWIDDAPFDRKHLDDIVDVREASDVTPWTTREIRRKLKRGKLMGAKANGKWLLSESQLINNDDVPITD